MANPLNNSFENWSSPGNPGIASGICDNWTVYSVNGGTSTRQTDAATGGETYSANIRSSASAPVNSEGGLTSDAFYLSDSLIKWWQKSENINVAVTVELYTSADVFIASTTPAIVTSWTQQSWDVSAYKGQNVKLRFKQHTTQSASGWYTLIDLVETWTWTLSLELEDIITLSDELEFTEVIKEDIVTLSDEIEINVLLEKIFLEDTITLSEQITGINRASYATRMEFYDGFLYISTDESPAQVVKVDVTLPSTNYTSYTLNLPSEDLHYAKDLKINQTFDEIYVACADGKLAHITNLTDLDDGRETIEVEAGSGANSL
ncbi:hypothetical protein LCGC14_3030410, partial [marine sediment metagenome]